MADKQTQLTSQVKLVTIEREIEVWALTQSDIDMIRYRSQGQTIAIAFVTLAIGFVLRTGWSILTVDDFQINDAEKFGLLISAIVAGGSTAYAIFREFSVRKKLNVIIGKNKKAK